MLDNNPYSTPATIAESIPAGPRITAGVFGNAWQLFIENLFVILSLLVIIMLPVSLIDSYLEYVVFTEIEDFGKLVRWSAYLANLVGIIATASIIFVGATAYSNGTPTFAGSLGAGVGVWFRIVCTRFAYSIAVLLGLLLLIVPGIYLMVRLSLAEIVVVVEKESAGNAFRRSFELTRGRGWFIFAIGVVVFVLTMAPLAVATFFALTYPQLDNWILATLAMFASEVAGAYGLLCFVCAYRELDDSNEVNEHSGF